MVIYRWHNSPFICSPTEPESSDLIGPWVDSDWKWFNTSNGTWHDREGGQWIKMTADPFQHTVSSAESGDINFVGTISVGGEVGLSGSKVLDGKKLTFSNGILIGYEAV